MGISENVESSQRLRLAVRYCIVPEAVRLFLEKNMDYRGQEFELGARAQFVDMHRKFNKLKPIIWEGYEPQFESAMEILKDLFGHVCIAMYLQDPAGWDAKVAEMLKPEVQYG